jgi:hypothetical protein
MSLVILNRKSILANSIKYGNSAMKFMDFVKYNNIGLNPLVDKLFHNIQRDTPIYMDDAMVEYFGYSGPMVKQRQSINDLIQANFAEYENQLWWQYKNNDYKEFLLGESDSNEDTESLLAEYSTNKNKADIYPPAPTGRGKTNIKHLLIMPQMFKEMLMMCQTDKGKQVRRYYITMVDVMEIYMSYQSTLVARGKDSKIDELKQLLITSEEKAEVRSEKSNQQIQTLLGFATEAKTERKDIKDKLDYVVVERVPQRHVLRQNKEALMIFKDPDDDVQPYYVSKIQRNMRTTTIKKS